MNEYARKSSHLLIGVGIAALIWILPKEVALPVIAVPLLVGLCIIDLCLKGMCIPGIHQILTALERPEEIPGKGAFFFVFATLIVLILFPSPIAAASVLVLSVQDGIATMAGISFGKHRIWNKKSWEGFAAGTVAAILVLLPWFPAISAICAGVMAGLAELVSPVDDNLVVPFVVALLLTGIPLLLKAA